MAKQYDKASKDVLDRIHRMRQKYHQHLDQVRIGALFVFTDEPECALKQQGYEKAAMAKIIGTQERAAGLPDALIVIDRYTYSGLTAKECDALIDHELTHIAPEIDDNGAPKFDVLDRPKLKMRLHDWQLGWFDEVAQRHGEHAPEVKQARELMEGSGQLYFDFSRDEAA